MCSCSCFIKAQIAQLVEQRTENPRVTGSIPVLGISEKTIVFDTIVFFIANLRKFVAVYSSIEYDREKGRGMIKYNE